MRIVFMGTPDFAVPSLNALCETGHKIVGVFTQPDKPRGRKQELTPPEVKVCALEHGLSVYQPASLRTDEAYALLCSLDPDIIIVAAYGKILPKSIIDLPQYGCVNVHASLLPKYRGAAPIQWAVLNGEKETGVTIMQMNEGLDTGDILIQKSIPINDDDTAESMFDKLAGLGAAMMRDALPLIERGELTPIPQDDALSTYSPMIDKSLCDIDWSMSADQVHNRVRGLYSWPIAQTVYNGKKLRIFRTSVTDGRGEPGEIIALSPLTVACGENAVAVHELQLEGKKRMKAADFLLGHRLEIGTILGA